MNVAHQQLDEFDAGADPIGDLLDQHAPPKSAWIAKEWRRTHKLSFSDIPKVTCKEPWPADAVKAADEFRQRVERDYVVMHVGDGHDPYHASTCVTRELAEQITALLHEQA